MEHQPRLSNERKLTSSGIYFVAARVRERPGYSTRTELWCPVWYKHEMYLWAAVALVVCLHRLLFKVCWRAAEVPTRDLVTMHASQTLSFHLELSSCWARWPLGRGIYIYMIYIYIYINKKALWKNNKKNLTSSAWFLLHKKQSLDILRSTITELSSQVISPLCNWMHGPDTLLVSGDVVAASAVSTGEYDTANPAQRTAAAPSSWSVLHGHSCGPSARPQGYFVQSKSITCSESIQWNVWASKVKNSMSVELTVLVMRMFIFTAKCFQQAKAPNIRWVVKDPAARLW